MPCGPDNFLVLDGLGQPLHPNLMSTALASFIRRRDLAPITFHGLRHTFASMANSARVPMYQISRAMGHAKQASRTGTSREVPSTAWRSRASRAGV